MIRHTYASLLLAAGALITYAGPFWFQNWNQKWDHEWRWGDG